MSVEHEILAKRFLKEVLQRKLNDLEKAASIAIQQGAVAKGEKQVEFWYIYLLKIDKLIAATKKELCFVEDFSMQKEITATQSKQTEPTPVIHKEIIQQPKNLPTVVPAAKQESVKKNWLYALLTEPIRLPFKK